MQWPRRKSAMKWLRLYFAIAFTMCSMTMGLYKATRAESLTIGRESMRIILTLHSPSRGRGSMENGNITPWPTCLLANITTNLSTGDWKEVWEAYRRISGYRAIWMPYFSGIMTAESMPSKVCCDDSIHECVIATRSLMQLLLLLRSLILLHKPWQIFFNQKYTFCADYRYLWMRFDIIAFVLESWNIEIVHLVYL